MRKYIIIMYSDYGKTVINKIHFNGIYQDARTEAHKLLYYDNRYMSFDIEIDV